VCQLQCVVELFVITDLLLMPILNIVTIDEEDALLVVTCELSLERSDVVSTFRPAGFIGRRLAKSTPEGVCFTLVSDRTSSSSQSIRVSFEQLSWNRGSNVLHLSRKS
jgi:hypothetical protein